MAKQSINLGRVVGKDGKPGAQGPQGPSGIGNAKVSNTYGTSTTDGYTQDYLNKKAQEHLRFNQLINPSKFISREFSWGTIAPNGKGSIIIHNKGVDAGNEFIYNDNLSLDITHYYYYEPIYDGERSGSYTLFYSSNGGVNRNNTIFTNCKDLRYISCVVTRDSGTFSITPILIDLTEMFGAGNEPKSVEEVQKYIEKNKYYPYTPIKATTDELTELAGKVATNTSAIDTKLTAIKLITQDNYVTEDFKNKTVIINGVYSSLKVFKNDIEVINLDNLAFTSITFALPNNFTMIGIKMDGTSFRPVLGGSGANPKLRLEIKNPYGLIFIIG